MIHIKDWQSNKDKWLDTDLSLMTSNEGWKERSKKKGILIWQRPFSDDKNDLFRWRLPKVTATHSEIFDVFTNKMLDYHQYWTAEYTGGYVVKEIEGNAQIIYQQFNPNVPFLSKRDLLYIQWSRHIDEKTIQTSLMVGGLMRMLSHSAELIPPLLVNKTDQFEKLTAKNINWRVLLSSPIGYVGEFGSSLPNRILPVQVNYIYQTVFDVKPETTLPWNEVEMSAQKVLIGGYSKLNSLRNYYESVVKGG
jgi:hypothetical protein